MVSIVFNLKYHSQNFSKLSIQGVFWNPEDEQIPKLSLGNNFDPDLRQQTGKQGVHFLMTSTVSIFQVSYNKLFSNAFCRKLARLLEILSGRTRFACFQVFRDCWLIWNMCLWLKSNSSTFDVSYYFHSSINCCSNLNKPLQFIRQSQDKK